MKTLKLTKTKLNDHDIQYLERLKNEHGLILAQEEVFVKLYTDYTPTFIVDKLGGYFHDKLVPAGEPYRFLKGIKASDIISLFSLEKTLASTLLDTTLDVERRLKASIVNSLCEYTREYNVPFGEKPSYILEDTKNRELEKIIEDLYNKRPDEITKEEFAIPVRKLIFDTTFGTSISIFNILKKEVQEIILSKWPVFEGNIMNFTQMLHLVRGIRNTIAHGDLLIKFTSKIHREILKQLNIEPAITNEAAPIYECLKIIDGYFYVGKKFQSSDSLIGIIKLFKFTLPAIERINELVGIKK